jgi:flagellar biogenesis protein FliO
MRLKNLLPLFFIILFTYLLHADGPPLEQPPLQIEIQQPIPEISPSTMAATNSYESAFVKMLFTLLLLLALIFITVWMLRKLSQGRSKAMSGHSVKILEKRPLSAKSILYVIEVGGKRILISESQLEVRTLSSIEEEPPSEA